MKVMVAPQKQGTLMDRSARGIKSLKPRVVGLTEMDVGKRTFLHAFMRVLGSPYRQFSRDKGDRSQECPLIVRIAALFCVVIKFQTYKLSDRVPNKSGLGNDRWVTIIWVKWFSKTWVIAATHLNAGVQNVTDKPYKIRNNAMVTAYRESVDVLEDILRGILADPAVGKRLIVMGDLNVLPEGQGIIWHWSPHKMFMRLHMDYVNSRVIYLAWGKGLRLRKHRIIKKGTNANGTDHDWILGWFGRAR